MLKLDTCKKTQLGEMISIGDILKGGSTHPMVVCINKKYPHMGQYVTVLLAQSVKSTIYGEERSYTIQEGFTFPLEEMIQQWSDLKVIGSIVVQ